MIRHLFKLIWNKKQTHALLIIEIWASFLVLFGLATLIAYNVRNYLQPLGFQYDNVWAISLNNNQDTVAIQEKIETIFQQVKAFPEVESLSRMSDSYPFSHSNNGRTIKYKNASSQITFISADENLSKTIDIPMVEGKWYRNADSVGKYRPVVINRKAEKQLFENESAVGKILGDNDGKGVWIVSGVIDYYKDKAEFMENKPYMFELLKSGDTWNKALVIHVKPGTDAVFEAKLVKNIASIAKGWSTEIVYLKDARQQQHDMTLIPVLIFLIVCSFLLINVALGLFGILNLSIARRRGEIGLRRAMGATEGKVTTQFLGEIWVLATFSLILGLLFAVQFPLLNVFDVAAGIYVTAILAAVLIIYLIVTLCAWYPSRQASRIHPAIALHED
ncbi:ABC transporter permease [Dyadobacter subterraneus]|uniref:FtsX-like permease family protein n=1 Tax=Dyadobacter subterraneus TaxID=2773304 RepID=A0ABR9WGS4_9BACT|nr:FtsX-like permease family protein [Dyadobacter subterraneus]MBE9464693.1 FtsX-like permease family protein [Dyadobacter subterraneus]